MFLRRYGRTVRSVRFIRFTRLVFTSLGSVGLWLRVNAIMIVRSGVMVGRSILCSMSLPRRLRSRLCVLNAKCAVSCGIKMESVCASWLLVDGRVEWQ